MAGELKPGGRGGGLIPDVRSWVRTTAGNPDYFLTQFLSGHGCFKSYLRRKCMSGVCPYCGVRDTPEHVVLKCMRCWRMKRVGLELPPSLEKYYLLGKEKMRRKSEVKMFVSYLLNRCDQVADINLSIKCPLVSTNGSLFIFTIHYSLYFNL